MCKILTRPLIDFFHRASHAVPAGWRVRILTLLCKQYSCTECDEYIVDSATIYATMRLDHISIANYSASVDKHSIKVHSYK